MPARRKPPGPAGTTRTASCFPASEDGTYAWSAAFVSYVMRIAGAGARFPYSASHSDYINLAKQMKLGQTSGWLIVAERSRGLCAAGLAT